MPTVKVTLAKAEEYVRNHDWTAIDAMTDDDIARWQSHELITLRERLGMTQAQFAEAYHLSLGAVRDLEQGRRQPSGPTAALLKVIERDPEFVRQALARAP